MDLLSWLHTEWKVCVCHTKLILLKRDSEQDYDLLSGVAKGFWRCAKDLHALWVYLSWTLKSKKNLKVGSNPVLRFLEVFSWDGINESDVTYESSVPYGDEYNAAD